MAHRFERKDKTEHSTITDSYQRSLELKLRGLKQEHRVILRQKNDLSKLLNEHRSELRKIKRPPLLVGTVQETLAEGFVIVRSTTGPSFMVYHSSDISSEELLPGTQVALNQRHFSVVQVIPSSEDPLVQKMEVENRPSTTYADIGGLDEQILEVAEVIELSLREPELFEKVGIESPKGVLLYGSPGTGKTMIAKAIAHETNAKFISVIGSELVQKYIGEGARMVRELFKFARRNSPAIIFIDEVDAIGSRRMDVGTSGDREVQRTFMQLLAELDGFDERGLVKVIAATNRPDILDPALLRHGRFDRHVEIPLPNKEGREAIFVIHTQHMNLRKDVDLSTLAGLTDGCSGADIKAICTEAGLETIRRKRVRVKQEDLLLAIDLVLERKNRKKEGVKQEQALLFH